MNRIVLMTLAAVAAMLTGCASGPGRCIGVSVPGATTGQKTLVNVDKDGLAIEGYDPVAYFTDKRPVKGDPRFRLVAGAAVYQFASAEHKAMFDASPEKYEPQYGGYCAYAASIDTISPIDPAFWEIVDGRLILQHNQKAWDAWHKDPGLSLVKADANWPGLVLRNGSPPRTLVNVDASGLALGGYDPVSYFDGGKPLLGDPAIARTYQGVTYRFASNEHKSTFEKDPMKYVPAFGGFCGYAASINKVSPVDPLIYQIINGRLVLQHTQRAYELFNKDAEASYHAADRNWPALASQRCK